MSDGDVTSEGGKLIAAWLNCVDNHRRHQQAMWDAFKDVQQTEAALSKWLAPLPVKRPTFSGSGGT